MSWLYCSGLKKCCSKPVIEKNCIEKDKVSGYTGKGEICTGEKTCSVLTTNAADTVDCCLGTCELPGKSECENHEHHSCKDSCANTEESTTYKCNGGKKCCKPKPENNLTIVWILLILMIIIVIVLIIFRNRIKLILFKKRSGVKESGAGRTRPGFFPPSSGGGMPRQQYPQRQAMPALRTISNQLPIRRPVKRDAELEETMKKLRDMSR